MKFKIKVFPNFSENKIKKSGEVLQIYVKEKPERNRANLAIIKLLGKHFNKPLKDIKLKGLTSKNKMVEIKND